jgi:hypothetical protein
MSLEMELPTEVTRTILQFVFAHDVVQARKVRLVCGRWEALLKPIIFRKLKLIFSVPRDELNRATFDRLGKDVSISSLVHCVEVLEWSESGLLPPNSPEIDHWVQMGRSREHVSSPSSTETQLRHLQALMPILPLRDFYWEAQPRMPAWFLSSLRQHLPGCSLRIASRFDYVTGKTLGSKEPTIPAMESIISLSLLKSMSTLKWLDVALAGNEPSLFHELQGVVQTCPRLECLTVYAIAQTCESMNRQDEVSSWPWKASAMPSTFLCPQVKRLSLQNFCICHDRDGSWESFAPWSLLQSLSLTCPSFFIRLGSKLENLALFHLNLDNRRQSSNCLRQLLSEPVKASLLNLKSLESLTINNISVIMDNKVLENIGARLKSLQLHEDEDYSIRNGRHAITHSQIRAIGEHCPMLTNLAVDVEHDLNWVRAKSSLERAELM